MALPEREFFTLDEAASEPGADKREIIEWGRKGVLPLYAFIENLTTLPGEYATNTGLWKGKRPDEMAMPGWFRECHAKIRPFDLPPMFGTRDEYDGFTVASFGIYGEEASFCAADSENGGWPLEPVTLEIHMRQLMLHVDDMAMLRKELGPGGDQEEIQEVKPAPQQLARELLRGRRGSDLTPAERREIAYLLSTEADAKNGLIADLLDISPGSSDPKDRTSMVRRDIRDHKKTLRGGHNNQDCPLSVRGRTTTCKA